MDIKFEICYTINSYCMRFYKMASDSNKKLLILYIWEILKKYSDENHYLTQNNIIEKVHQIYGMECERKSVSANIEDLENFGVDIIKVPHKGCFIGERDLEPSEVAFITDAIFSSKSIDGAHAKTLVQKISKSLSKYQRKKYNYIYKADQVTRTNNYDLFWNIEVIQEAIEKGKKISFRYNRPSFEKENKKKLYIVNPYFLINSQGRYYLVCNYDYYDEIGNYKVELISDIKILDLDIKPVTSMKGYKNGIDIAKYTNEHIYVFSKESVRATLKLSGEHSVGYIIDWFGVSAKIYKKNDILYADIESNEQALIYWCLQYGESVELITPKSTRSKIIEKIDSIHLKYKGEK